jgi:hypothetical protein
MFKKNLVLCQIGDFLQNTSKIFHSKEVSHFKWVVSRVARWFVFKPKIPIWVNFGGFCYGKSWYIL